MPRRKFIKYGTVTSLGVGLAGCNADSGSQSQNSTGGNNTTQGTAVTTAESTSTDESTDTAESTNTSEKSGQSALHPVYGFTAPSADVEPPVEPDHEVQMLFGDVRENQPEWASESIAEVYFEPTGLYIEPGDVVKFNAATPHHNVMSYHPAYAFSPRVPKGVPPLASPILATDAYWLYRFDTEGVYDLNCSPHQFMGMAMRIVVGSATGPGAEPLPELGTKAATVSDLESGGKEPRLPSGTAYTVLQDSALDPKHIINKKSVKWEKLADESKQLWPIVVGPPNGDSETTTGTET